MFDPLHEHDDPEVFVYGSCTDDELVTHARLLAAQRAALDAEEAELLMEVQRRRSLGVSPFRDTAAWLRHATGVSAHTARVRAQAARELAWLPGLHAELARGTIAFDHLRPVVEQANSANRDQVHEDEPHLIRLAKTHDADGFRDAVAEWARDLDNQRDAGQTEAERKRRRRRMRRCRTPEGLRRTILDLDDEADAVLYGMVRKVMGEMSRADRNAGVPVEQRRSFDQLGADAFVEVARRAAGADVLTKHKARPTILALTDARLLWDQLRVNGYCELSDGTKLTAAQLRRLACEADVIPVVLGTDGVVLDMGRSVRLGTFEQRLALRVMHPTCAVEGCDVDFDWCEIHHLRPWEKDGLTDLENLVPLCGFHHHLIHDWGLESTVTVEADRTISLRTLPNSRTPRRSRQLRDRRKLRQPDLVPAR